MWLFVFFFYIANAFDVDKSKVACDRKPYYYYDPFTYGKRTFFFLKSLRFSFSKNFLNQKLVYLSDYLVKHARRVTCAIEKLALNACKANVFAQTK